MSDGPEVTVVIPTRDRWTRLSTAALPSALAQEAVRMEVVVVDDGSVDGTPDHLARLGDERIRVIRHDRPNGVARARNAGIAAAAGSWVAFLDDDDLWAPSKLRLQLEAARRSDAIWVYAAGAATDASHRFLFAVEAPRPETVATALLRWNVIWSGSSNVVARTDVLRRLGGFDERLFQLADWDMWIRLALAGRAAVVDEVVVAYVVHDASMLLTVRADVFPEFAYLQEKHSAAASAHRTSLDGALFWRWVAQGHRRAGRRLTAARVYLDGSLRHRDVGAAVRALGSLLPDRWAAAARKLMPFQRSGDPLRGSAPGWLRAAD